MNTEPKPWRNDRPLVERLRLHADNKTKRAMQIDCEQAATALEVMQNDLNTALGMLAGWCVAVEVNGAGWDDWDERYKDAMYRDGPLRSMLDAAIYEQRKWAQ